MVREVTNHGASGYRRGCKCEVCRTGHRKSVADWRARKRRQQTDSPKVEAPRAPLTSSPTLNPDAPAGPIESAFRVDLGKLVGEPPWKDTLSALALYNARLLDQLPTLDRLDLASPVQLRTMEVLDRLRGLEKTSGGLDAEAQALINGLGSP